MWGRGGSALDLLLQVALEVSMSRVQARLGQTGPWGLGGLGRPQLCGSTHEPQEGGEMGRASGLGWSPERLDSEGQTQSTRSQEGRKSRRTVPKTKWNERVQAEQPLCPMLLGGPDRSARQAHGFGNREVKGDLFHLVVESGDRSCLGVCSRVNAKK